MNRSLYIGATSMIANRKRMDVLTNNLANVNTTGYKKDLSVHESFAEKLMIKKSRYPERTNVSSDNGFSLEKAGDAYIAKVKHGYFTMETPSGHSYVKEIKVAPDAEGYLKTFYRTDYGLKTDYENYVLDKSGQRIQATDGAIEETLKDSVMTPLPFVIGTMSRGVKFQKVVTDFTKGSYIDTGDKLDTALSNDGFYKVIDPANSQVYYTRNGSFSIEGGFLKDLQGRNVLVNGAPLEVADENGYEHLDITENGSIYVDDNLLGKLDIVRVQDRELLRKVGENAFKPVEGYTAVELPYEGTVLQGYLETSNVNAVESMVEMIQLQRDYDANQRVITTTDEMLQKSATELGRL